MSTFGKSQDIGEGVDFKLYTGAENFKVVALNPTKEEMEKMYGRELNFTPEYKGKITVQDTDGEREVDQIRLDFFLANEDNSITTKLQFYIANTHHKSQTGSYKVINNYGRSTWMQKEHIQNKTLPAGYEKWYHVDGLKVAKRGEPELLDFLINLLNLPMKLDKVEDLNDALAYISKEVWADMFDKQDFSFLRGIIANTNNKIGVLMGVKTKGDGKLTQTTFNRSTMRQYVLGGNKSNEEKFKYILKDLDEAKANGAFSNVEFGPRDLAVREFSVAPTTINSDNTNQLDVFATADVPTTTNDAEDWFEE